LMASIPDHRVEGARVPIQVRLSALTLFDTDLLGLGVVAVVPDVEALPWHAFRDQCLLNGGGLQLVGLWNRFDATGPQQQGHHNSSSESKTVHADSCVKRNTDYQ